ncbi:LPS O-antigen chain length determinant protein WzzB [Actinobacillus porcinus]|uniref:LPS O-antigen chain length determinant protein WzzB n=1 Tax=Actinobacillus porcinus TaxID=51048 RepID=UPI002A916058|nr:Wzz/FepE/Etk N-terminal domain-containing protein [Actinobacillus porcinus]MDY6215263.1 Wzz/FepE/Etk N-terminal domain-containing protein [Actinobacillus porcinus]
MSTLSEQRNDEIDLIELIKVLWDKKVRILISTFLFTAIAGVYAFTAKEQWTSKAEVIAPTQVDVGRYANVKLRFAQIANQQDVTFDSIAEGLYSQFERLIFSQNERRDFFIQSDEYKRLIAGLDENAQRKVLSNLSIEYTAIVRPDPKKNQDMFGNRISFSSETPLSAQQTLSEFISFVNKKAFNLDKSSFQFQIAQKIEALETEKEEIETTLSAKKDLNISSINNIQSQATSRNNSAVGQNQSTQPLDAAAELLIYGDDYARLQLRLIDSHLKQLNALQEEVKSLEGQAFSYQASPDYPVAKDKPKRLFILLGGAISGGLLSILVLIIGYLFKQNRRLENKG